MVSHFSGGMIDASITAPQARVGQAIPFRFSGSDDKGFYRAASVFSAFPTIVSSMVSS